MRLRVVLVALAVFAAMAAAAFAAAGGRRVVGNCTKSQVQPSSIILACADANAALTKLRWTSFGGGSARATGSYTANDCTPNCAAGKFHSSPITLTLSGAKACPDGHDDYRHASWKWSAGAPKGSIGTTFTLSCPLRG
jgi:hypothetical protein